LNEKDDKVRCLPATGLFFLIDAAFRIFCRKFTPKTKVIANAVRLLPVAMAITGASFTQT
jgi:hypothetical protein